MDGQEQQRLKIWQLDTAITKNDLYARKREEIVEKHVVRGGM